MLHDPGGSSTDPHEAESAFVRLHAGGQPGAVTTVLLLLTAWRSRRCTSQLLSRGHPHQPVDPVLNVSAGTWPSLRFVVETTALRGSATVEP